MIKREEKSKLYGEKVVMSPDKRKKRDESIEKFSTRLGKKIRENEKRAAGSIEYAKHAIAR